MKAIIHTLITLLIVFMNTEVYSNVISPDDDKKTVKSSFVPLSPRNWDDMDLVVPENLKFIKAEFAQVPLAAFVWGNPDDKVPAELYIDQAITMIPIAPIVWDTIAPEGAQNIKSSKASMFGIELSR